MTPFDLRFDAALRQHLTERKAEILENLSAGQYTLEEYKFWCGYVKCVSDMVEFVADVKDRILKE